MPEKKTYLSGLNVLLALALLLLVTIIGREVMRQRAVSRRASPASPVAASGPVTAPGAPGVVAAGAAPAVAPAEVRLGPRLAAAPAAPLPTGREIPNSRLDQPHVAQRVLRAQTRALREESAADTLDPARRRALSLTQEEILEIEKDDRLIF